jgi:hypothetical protein
VNNISGTATELETLVAAETAGTITLKNSFIPTVTGAATAAQLNSISSATLAVGGAFGVTTITGSAADFATFISGNRYAGADNFAAIITGAFTLAEWDVIDGATTGTVSPSRTSALDSP